MFEKQDYRRDRKPTRPLTDIYLKTRRQATLVPGLCRYDGVSIELEAATPREQGADTPMRATGLSSTSYFAFVAPPADDYEEIENPDLIDTGECAGLPDDYPFFAADDEYRATQGYRAFAALLEALGNEEKVLLECNLFRSDDGKSCEEIIAALGPDQLSSVGPCDRDPDWSTECQRIYVADRRIDIRLTAHVSPGPPAGKVVSAKLDSLIIMAHERID